MFPTGRHAAPRAWRAVVLPSALLLSSGCALTALAVVPAEADGRRAISGTVQARSAVLESTPTTELLQAWQDAPPDDTARRERDAAWTRAKAAADRRAAALRASRARRAALAPTPTPAPTPTVAPTPPPVRPGVGALTSRYGPRWGRLHAGIDLAAGVGAPVSAVAEGVVLSADHEGGYGKVVRVQHSQGTVSLYAHLSEVLVTAGQPVGRGALLGREGSSGHSTGPHLHFEIRIGDVPVDPLPWLAARGLAL